jgi:hypothetical protein
MLLELDTAKISVAISITLYVPTLSMPVSVVDCWVELPKLAADPSGFSNKTHCHVSIAPRPDETFPTRMTSPGPFVTASVYVSVLELGFAEPVIVTVVIPAIDNLSSFA